MSNFTKKELFMSLFMPSVVLLWYGSISILKVIVLDDKLLFSPFHMFCIITFLIGGVLPIILTLSLKIHTERYMLKRLICCVFFYMFRNLMMGDPTVIFVFNLLIAVLIIILEVVKIQDEYTTGSERTVLMLSDPVIYWLIEIIWRYVEEKLMA